MRRILGGLAALALSITGLLGAATPAHATTPTVLVTAQSYAALGDSFAAGYGLPPKSATDVCARSNLAYPELLNGLRSLKKLDFLACSGATTGDVLGGQVTALDASTRTVTLTIGGNDLGFGQLACLANGCDLSQLIATVGPALGALATGDGTYVGPSGKPVWSVFSVIGSIHARAPNARIFVTGYPELFGTSSKVFGTRTACPVTLTNRTAVNTVVAQLNSVISGSVAAAKAAGVGVTYVGVAGAFDGHGVCDSRTPFISPVLHPNVLGQGTYAVSLVLRGVAR